MCIEQLLSFFCHNKFVELYGQIEEGKQLLVLVQTNFIAVKNMTNLNYKWMGPKATMCLSWVFSNAKLISSLI